MILREARRPAVAVDEGSLKVTPAPYAVQVEMEWKHPVML